MQVFLDEVSTFTHRLSKVDCPPLLTGIIQSLEGLHRTKRGREGDLSLSLCLTIWARTLVVSCLWTKTYTINVLGSKARIYVHNCTHIHAFSTPGTISVLSIATVSIRSQPVGDPFRHVWLTLTLTHFSYSHYKWSSFCLKPIWFPFCKVCNRYL